MSYNLLRVQPITAESLASHTIKTKPHVTLVPLVSPVQVQNRYNRQSVAIMFRHSLGNPKRKGRARGPANPVKLWNSTPTVYTNHPAMQ